MQFQPQQYPHQFQMPVMNTPTAGGTSIETLLRQKEQNTDESSGKQSIINFANEVSNVLDELSEDEASDTEEDEVKEKKDSWLADKFSVMWKEFLILLVIYVIMSHSYIRKYIEMYVPIRNSEGVVNTLGFIIYGSLVALIYVIIKNILL